MIASDGTETPIGETFSAASLYLPSPTIKGYEGATLKPVLDISKRYDFNKPSLVTEYQASAR